MHALQKQHIVDLFVWVDDAVASLPQTKESNKGGRPPALRDSELLPILIWDGLSEPHKTLSSLYTWIVRDYADYFPKMPAYQNFVAHCHRLLPALAEMLGSLMVSGAPLRFCDSTMLEVCKLVRADRHKVAKGVAAFGRNHQGWHYGFKLHAAVDQHGRLAAICFTSANEYDAQHIERLVNKVTRIVVGDSHYAASPMRKRLLEEVQDCRCSQQQKADAHGQLATIAAHHATESGSYVWQAQGATLLGHFVPKKCQRLFRTLLTNYS